jgi:hypothetical protein
LSDITRRASSINNESPVGEEVAKAFGANQRHEVHFPTA